MTNTPPQNDYPDVPAELAGKWIAWKHDQSEILASGRDCAQVRSAAMAKGEPRPLLEKIPRADARFVGGL